MSLVLAIILIALSIVHIYWAFGGRWAWSIALPSDQSGKIVLHPSKITTLIVALVLMCFGLVYLHKSGKIDLSISEQIIQYISWIIPGIFILRGIGDLRYCGLFKKVRNTQFASYDTMIFTPLCFLIGILGVLIMN